MGTLKMRLLDATFDQSCSLPTSCRCWLVGFLSLLLGRALDRILNRYALVRTLDEARVAESREKISRYIEKLAAAGQKDTRQLTVYGLAYLKELHEGRDPRFTGC